MLYEMSAMVTNRVTDPFRRFCGFLLKVSENREGILKSSIKQFLSTFLVTTIIVPLQSIYHITLTLSPGGAGTPTQHSLCLHFDPSTMWAFKTDPLRHFFKW